MKQEDDETIFHHELLPNSCLIIIDRNVPQTQGLFSNVSGYFLSGFCVSSRVTRLIYLHTTYERRKYMNERLNLERKLFKEDFCIEKTFQSVACNMDFDRQTKSASTKEINIHSTKQTFDFLNFISPSFE